MKLFAILVFALVGGTTASHWPIDPATGEQGVGGSSPTFDCNMRKLAYKYGKQLIPRMDKFDSLWYALDLNDPTCTVELENDATTEKKNANTEKPEVLAFYVHPQGDDHNDGLSVEHPVQSIQLAVDRAAASETIKTVVLRGGVHYVPETIMLGPQHSNIEIKNYPGESPEVSGGVELANLKWTSYNTSNGANIWSADIGSQGKWTPPKIPAQPVDYFTDAVPSHDRNVTADGWFEHYMIGVNGLCSVYDPPVSYWCSEHPSGGGAFAFRTPSGVQLTQGGQGSTLPNAPYKNADGMQLFVWRPARWANWMFSME
eukprot:gene16633-4984_t